VDRRRWMEKEEKEIMDIERGFPLLKILGLKICSLKSYESRCIFPLLPTFFTGLR